MFGRLGAFVARHWALVIFGWIALAAGVHFVAPRWDDVTQDGDLAYLPSRMPSVEGEALLARAFRNQRAKSQIAVIVERPKRFSAADLAWIDGLGELFENERGELPIVDIWTHRSEVVGDKLLSRPSAAGQASVILLQLSNEFMATDNIRVFNRVNQIVEQARQDTAMPSGLNVGISGSAAIGGDMLLSSLESIKNTELMTVLLVVLVLLVVYRAPAMVVIPLVTIGLSLIVATDLLALLTRLHRVQGFEWWHFQIFKTTKIFIIVILFGAGTDFCLFLISRYKEEILRGANRDSAVGQALGHVGGAIVASAMTTILGLGTMAFAAFGKYRNSGPAIALSLAVALVACLTFAPALLQALGGAVFWPFKRPSPGDGQRATSRFWDWASRVILARPGLILAVSLVVLAPWAYFGLSTRLTYDFLGELRDDRPSVVGTEMARRHFPAGDTSPVVVAAITRGGQLNSEDGNRAIGELTKTLYDEAGVARVRSLAEPLGDRPGLSNPFSAAGRRKIAARKHPRTRGHFMSEVPEFAGDVTLFEVILKDDPFSAQAIDTLDRLDGPEGVLTKTSHADHPIWKGAEFRLLGVTAGVRDLRAVTQSDQILISELVVLAVLAVLILVLRRPVLSLYLIASVLFSYFVTVGATQLFFAWLAGPTFPGLDWKVPLFLFVILIAVGEDYNIYLVTRVIEEQRAHGLREGLRLAVAQTGGIITSCGVIMAGTFVSMTTGTLRGIQELGFALSLGVMLDTCVVRPILVPAFMALLLNRRVVGERPTTAVAPQRLPNI